MRIRQRLVPALLALALCAGPAAADIPPWLLDGGNNLNLSEMGAVLALPIVTGGHAGQTPWKISEDVVVEVGGDAVTIATVTNAKDTPIKLKVEMIDGDPVGGSSDTMQTWRSTSFECLLSGRETTAFLFKGAGNGTSEVYVECSSGLFPMSDTNGNPTTRFTGVQNGILFVAVADPFYGAVMNQDVIFGDAVIVDTASGQAWSFDAISFQSGSGFGDGNEVYRFDGQEYRQFPAVLATNFLAPVADEVQGELILFTLDGTAGSSPAPRAMVSGLVYNDDEQFADFQYVFDCFDIVPLDALSEVFVHSRTNPGLGLGSPAGHLELIPQPVATANDAHDDFYGDGNDSRTRGVHGWLVQAVTPGSRVLDEQVGGSWYGFPQPNAYRDLPTPPGGMPGSASWGRPLSQGTRALRPLFADLPSVFDADSRH